MTAPCPNCCATPCRCSEVFGPRQFVRAWNPWLLRAEIRDLREALRYYAEGTGVWGQVAREALARHTGGAE